MSRRYQLIALDMDGTVLNEKKEIDGETRAAIHDALAAGLDVVFCTGRSYSEMETILKEFPDMKYLCGESGALVMALRTGKILHQEKIETAVAELLLEASRRKDIMSCVFSNGVSYMNQKDLPLMDYYQMGQYQESFRDNCRQMEENVLEKLLKDGCPMEKINLYHTSVQERTETRAWLKERQIRAEVVDSETSSLECSPPGVSKATGLESLCRELGLTMEQAVMVGDADNDLAAMKAAGMAIAMGNANAHVKAICDLEVADNCHQGCAQAIRYVMAEG